MELATVFERYKDAFVEKYAATPFFEDRLRALDAVLMCRTGDCGEIQAYCPHCDRIDWFPHSCGHRNCPKCQNYEATRWLERQRKKLLPVEYFLATFTLPGELRGVSRYHPKEIYDLFFSTSTEALRELAANPRFLGGDIGLTGVLQTNSRRQDYHPHIHYVVPGCAFNQNKNCCIRPRTSYLVNESALGRLFRGKFLDGLKKLGITFPKHLYKIDWVVDCEPVGKGEPALKYLSRYLYRGVISEKDILSDSEGQITFRYVDRKTGKFKFLTLPGADFLQLILQHVLPKGYRRIRDFGFLHGNAKRVLRQLQLLLIAKPRAHTNVERPAFVCSCCGGTMRILSVQCFFNRIRRNNRSPPAAIPPLSA